MNQRSAVYLIALAILNSTAMTGSVVEARGNYQQQQQSRPAQQQQQPNRSAEEEQARAAQEQAVRAQEEQARQAQAGALRQQQEAARQQQEQERQAQQQASRQQQEAARQQQEQERQAQQQASRQQQEAARQQQEQERAPQQQEARQQESRGAEGQRNTHEANAVVAAVSRPVEPQQFAGKSVPLEKAISMPVLEQNATGAEREHAQTVTQNLQRHLIAVPVEQAPSNFRQIQSASVNNYLNNYPSFINNRRLVINRENTFFNNVPQYEYPYWWHSSPGWAFSNGFTLGSLATGLDWLRWGWHPYYGPLPDGFVCATDYVPTPWIYFPAYGLWRQPGVMGWAPAGPPFNYTGPISVEVLEPRHLTVNDPYTGFATSRIINVPYLYNAYFNPQFDRWGYTNRHGYFILLNL